jgi:hypothetical protein
MINTSCKEFNDILRESSSIQNKILIKVLLAVPWKMGGKNGKECVTKVCKSDSPCGEVIGRCTQYAIQC